MTFQRPKVRKRPRMGVRPDPHKVREFPTHRAFVRRHECIVPGCRDDDIQACHVRKGLPKEDAGATQLKSFDWWCFAACADHHREQGNIGEEPFERKYRIELKTAAKWFAANTTDMKMREFLREREGKT